MSEPEPPRKVSAPVGIGTSPADDSETPTANVATRADPRVKLEKTIKQAQARLDAINARIKSQKRKDKNHGAIVFAAYAKKLAPQVFDKAIADLESRKPSYRVSGDLRCLLVFKNYDE